jgi:hypothetical protein
MCVEQSVFDKRHSTNCLRLHTTGIVYVNRSCEIAAQPSAGDSADGAIRIESLVQETVWIHGDHGRPKNLK